MPNYTFMHIDKIKDSGHLTAKCNHNLRKVNVKNADDELAKFNKILCPSGKPDASQLDYRQAFNERIAGLEYYKSHKVYSNAVLGYDIVMTFPRGGDPLKLALWQAQTLKWLHDTFDIAPDHKSNVVNVVFHADEMGAPHIHAFVIPIDKNGHLDACYFTGSAAKLSKLQTIYAKYVEVAGLERGIAGSSARHEDIRKMYAALNRALDVPEVREGETAAEYRHRIIDQYQTAAAVKHRESTEQNFARRRSSDRYIQEQRESLEDEAGRIREDLRVDQEAADKKLKKVQADTEEAEEQLDILSGQISYLAQQMYEQQMELKARQAEKERAKKLENIMKGLEIMDPDEAELIKAGIEKAEAIAAEWAQSAEAPKPNIDDNASL